MAPDPAGQFYSPYISMGNNPVSGVDPDGGYVNGHGGYHDYGSYTVGTYWGNMNKYYYSNGIWFETRKDATAYEHGAGERYWAEYNALIEKYMSHTSNGASFNPDDNYQSEMYNLNFKYGKITRLSNLNSNYSRQGYGDADDWFNGGTGSLEAKTEAGLNYVMNRDYNTYHDLSINGVYKGSYLSREAAEKEAADFYSPNDEGITLDANGIFTQKVQTPPESKEKRVFTVMYAIGQNDAKLSADFYGYADKLSVWYDDGENPGFKLLYANNGRKNGFNLDFSLIQIGGKSPNLAGATLYISIQANETSETSRWKYIYTNTGGSFIGSNYGFMPVDFRGFGVINWFNPNAGW